MGIHFMDPYTLSGNHIKVKYGDIPSNATVLYDNNSNNGPTKLIFLHIPKTGGLSFQRSWKKTLHLNFTAYPISNTERVLNEAQFRKYNAHLMTFVRNPVTHIISQYNHCQQPGAFGQELHHYPNLTFENYLMFGLNRSIELRRFCSYDPYNLLLNWLSFGTGSLQKALRTVKDSFFVGVLEFQKASYCVLIFEEGMPLPDWCNCKNEVVQKFPNAKHGVKAEKFLLRKKHLSLISKLTLSDNVIYGAAIQRLFRRAEVILNLTHVQLLC